jgi:hypothetical protein
VEGTQTRADTIAAASGHCGMVSHPAPPDLPGLPMLLLQHVETRPTAAPLVARHHPARKELP